MGRLRGTRGSISAADDAGHCDMCSHYGYNDGRTSVSYRRITPLNGSACSWPSSSVTATFLSSIRGSTQKILSFSVMRRRTNIRVRRVRQRSRAYKDSIFIATETLRLTLIVDDPLDAVEHSLQVIHLHDGHLHRRATAHRTLQAAHLPTHIRRGMEQCSQRSQAAALYRGEPYGRHFIMILDLHWRLPAL